MTNPELYRDDSRVRHMLDAMEHILAIAKDMSREQLCYHEGNTERILFNMMVLGEAANNITREFAAQNPSVAWKDLANVRHKIVHDYADIDFDTIWDILQNEISGEYEKVKAVAATLPPEPATPPPNMEEFL